MLNLHIVCELGFCPADWFCNLKNFGFWTFSALNDFFVDFNLSRLEEDCF